ncbi:MAG: DUF2065 family protein [Gammaproteobacteria bacterium]|nr:DUF2065 family protein [Gammaproteobacteria bacterium]
MDWNDFLTAFGLYLVLEGILPFLSPEAWRRSMAVLAAMPGQKLRIFGLLSMLLGALLLVAVRSAG